MGLIYLLPYLKNCQTHGYKYMRWMKRLALVANISCSNNQPEIGAQIRMGRLQCPLFMFHLNGKTMGWKLFVKISSIKYEENPARESSAVPSAHMDERKSCVGNSKIARDFPFRDHDKNLTLYPYKEFRLHRMLKRTIYISGPQFSGRLASPRRGAM